MSTSIMHHLVIGDKSFEMIDIEARRTDPTLSLYGKAADASAVGDAINGLQSEIDGKADSAEIQEAVNGINLEMETKVDNGYVEDGVAYFCSGDDVLFQITGIGGGGGGGGDSGNNAIITVTNTTGWLQKTISYGYACNLTFNWSSLEDDQPTGFGSMSITVNGAAKAIRTIRRDGK